MTKQKARGTAYGEYNCLIVSACYGIIIMHRAPPLLGIFFLKGGGTMRFNLKKALAYLGLAGSVCSEMAAFGKKIISFVDELD